MVNGRGEGRTDISLSGSTVSVQANHIVQYRFNNSTGTISGAVQPLQLDQQIRSELIGVNPRSSIDQVRGIQLTNADWMTDLQNSVMLGLEGFFTNLLIGLTKALVAIQILIMALMIGIMTDMLSAMVAAGLPLFLMLSLIPKVGDIANKMIQALPAILLLPLMSAVIIVVGAGAVAEAGGPGSPGNAHFVTWISSIGVVFFAITLPVIMIPLLGSVTQMATQVVSSAVNTSAMVTGMAATSAVTATMDARKMGMGAGGMAKAFGGGLIRGGIASHGSVGDAGNIGPGSMHLPTNQMIGGVGQGADIGHIPGAEKLAPTKEQDEIIHNAAHTVKTSVGGAKEAGALVKGGMVSTPWDNSLSVDENRAAIDKEVKEFVDETSIDENVTIDKNQQEAIYNWYGPKKSMYMFGDEGLQGEVIRDEMSKEDRERVADSRIDAAVHRDFIKAKRDRLNS